jgi:putative oxidoreductase
MRIAIIIVRVLLGGLMLFASISYFFKLGDQPAPTGDMATVMAGFMASKYMFPLVKVIELLAGISLVSGKFMRAFLLILLPISVNIFLLHAVVTKSDLPVAAFVLLANLFLIYANWNSYKHLFEWK